MGVSTCGGPRRATILGRPEEGDGLGGVDLLHQFPPHVLVRETHGVPRLVPHHAHELRLGHGHGEASRFMVGCPAGMLRMSVPR